MPVLAGQGWDPSTHGISPSKASNIMEPSAARAGSGPPHVHGADTTPPEVPTRSTCKGQVVRRARPQVSGRCSAGDWYAKWRCYIRFSQTRGRSRLEFRPGHRSMQTWERGEKVVLHRAAAALQPAPPHFSPDPCGTMGPVSVQLSRVGS